MRVSRSVKARADGIVRMGEGIFSSFGSHESSSWLARFLPRFEIEKSREFVWTILIF